MNKHKLISGLAVVVALGLLAGGYYLGVPLLQERRMTRAPQSGALSPQQIDNSTYDATNGAEQVIAVGRGATSPQTNNLSQAQIANSIYDPTNGAKQVILSSNSSDIAFINTTSLTAGDVLYYDASNTEWDNTQGQLGISGVGSSPLITLKNPTAEDTDGGRESTIAVKGLQSGSEETTLGKIEISHSGSADDEKGQFLVYVNDGNDGDSPQEVFTITETGLVEVRAVDAGTSQLYLYQNNIARGLIDASQYVFGIAGTGAAEVNLQRNANLDVYVFAGAVEGETPSLDITGYRTGDASRTMEIGISPDANDQGKFDGVSSYVFDGGIIPDFVTADPCGTLPEGSLFYNSTADVYCFCNGAGADLKVSDGSACF